MDAKNMLMATPLPPTHSRRHKLGRQPTVDVQRTEHQHRSITNSERTIDVHIDGRQEHVNGNTIAANTQ
ncbi:hypothetical protein Taro_005563 [Colocasia esculenta]|uniref:Uncharacterized protein n=1 Tax=Colocasia esculenta TaxID=4460 RepID=A0A843TSQ4_COLES|nr:hypothetical protein [Colocasia esculenta]